MTATHCQRRTYYPARAQTSCESARVGLTKKLSTRQALGCLLPESQKSARVSLATM